MTQRNGHCGCCWERMMTNRTSHRWRTSCRGSQERPESGHNHDSRKIKKTSHEQPVRKLNSWDVRVYTAKKYWGNETNSTTALRHESGDLDQSGIWLSQYTENKGVSSHKNTPNKRNNYNEIVFSRVCGRYKQHTTKTVVTRLALGSTWKCTLAISRWISISIHQTFTTTHKCDDTSPSCLLYPSSFTWYGTQSSDVFEPKGMVTVIIFQPKLLSAHSSFITLKTHAIVLKQRLHTYIFDACRDLSLF